MFSVRCRGTECSSAVQVGQECELCVHLDMRQPEGGLTGFLKLLLAALYFMENVQINNVLCVVEAFQVVWT